MDLRTFLSRHPVHPPAIDPENSDQVRLLVAADGVLMLNSPPALAVERAVPDRSGDPGCHLWVFGGAGIPYVLERGAVVTSLASGVVKHTNLTGGEPAAAGGELWVDPADDARLYVNGCSGRYGPRTPGELDDAVSVFRGQGFDVCSFGWDADANKPARVRR